MSDNIYNPDGKEIRFVNIEGREIFRIPDGGYIVMTRPEGEEYIYECKYRDDYHTFINGNVYHIDEYAARMYAIGARLRPDPEPETNVGYRIIQRNHVKDKVFKLGFNPNAVQKYVTWQSYPDNPAQYDWGHYWNDRSIANTDLFRRTDAEKRGKSYDYATLIQRSDRDDAR